MRGLPGRGSFALRGLGQGGIGGLGPDEEASAEPDACQQDESLHLS